MMSLSQESVVFISAQRRSRRTARAPKPAIRETRTASGRSRCTRLSTNEFLEMLAREYDRCDARSRLDIGAFELLLSVDRHASRGPVCEAV